MAVLEALDSGIDRLDANRMPASCNNVGRVGREATTCATVANRRQIPRTRKGAESSFDRTAILAVPIVLQDGAYIVRILHRGNLAREYVFIVGRRLGNSTPSGCAP